MARAAGAQKPSVTTLSELPARVLTFLVAIATRPPIHALLRQAGYRDEDHDEGSRLLSAVWQLNTTLPSATTQAPSQGAFAEVHAWVTANFRRYQAAVARLHPTWLTLFPDIDTRYPDECLRVAATLLEELRNGEASRAESLQATLALRGLTTLEMERLSALVTTALRVDGSGTACSEHNDRTTELIALYHWYRDWTESAKQFVKRKDYRVMLGIASKREP